MCVSTIHYNLRDGKENVGFDDTHESLDNLPVSESVLFVGVCVGRLSIIYRQFGVSLGEQCSTDEQGFSSFAGKIAAFCSYCRPDSFTAPGGHPKSGTRTHGVVVEFLPENRSSFFLSPAQVRTTPGTGLPSVSLTHARTHTESSSSFYSSGTGHRRQTGHR